MSEERRRFLLRVEELIKLSPDAVEPGAPRDISTAYWYAPLPVILGAVSQVFDEQVRPPGTEPPPS